MHKLTFHGVEYEPSVGGPRDSSTRIALDFAHDSRATADLLSESSDKLSEATMALAQAVKEGLSFREIGDHQEAFQVALREFEGLHRKWVTQSTSARRVLQDYWTCDEQQQVRQ